MRSAGFVASKLWCRLSATVPQPKRDHVIHFSARTAAFRQRSAPSVRASIHASTVGLAEARRLFGDADQRREVRIALANPVHLLAADAKPACHFGGRNQSGPCSPPLQPGKRAR